MRRTSAMALIAFLTAALGAQTEPRRGVPLTSLTWLEAERVLDGSAIVVIPVGAALKEHGPHLKLNNDERLAAYLQSRVQSAAQVAIAAPLPYHFYPAFSEYPGSTTLTYATSRDLTVEVVRSLARHGPRRFYALNTGISTARPLEAAARVLADEGVLLHYTDIEARLAPAVRSVQQQAGGTHADEIETSMMLYVDPASVDMTKAVREYSGNIPGPLTRVRGGRGAFSASGVYGDPTLATREKGRILVETLVRGILEDIDKLRVATLPVARSTGSTSSATATGAARGEPTAPNGCTPGDERRIREVGARFSVFWRQMDSEAISLMFTATGDIRHPDGTIERSQPVIRENRRYLFTRPEYRGSVHPVNLNDIRCLDAAHAIADGKWELRLADAPESGRGGQPRIYDGWCTLVLSGLNGVWSIEAWRYTVNPPNGTPPPTTLKQPGFLGRQERPD